MFEPGRYPQSTRTRKIIVKIFCPFLFSIYLGYSFNPQLFMRRSLVCTINTCGGRAGHGSVLSAASRKPVLNDGSDNPPTRKKSKSNNAATEPVAVIAAHVAPNSVSAKKVVAPNANSRTATDTPAPQPLNPMIVATPAISIKKKKPVPSPSSDLLDRDDSESAMR